MEVFDVFATFSMLDNITGPLGNIRKGFAQTGLAGGRLSDRMGVLTKSMLPFVAAAGLFLAALAPAVGVAANFEASISSLGAISKASASDMKIMESAALDLGASTAFSAAQIVQGQTELAKTGFAANQVVAAMPGLLDLAAATQSDLALASTVASGALKSFHMEASRTGEVADIIAAAATSSATDINGLEAAVSNAGAIVSSAGGDFAELAAITGKLADVNVNGAVAGTGISIMYSRLQAPVGEAAKALEKLGVTTKDASGNMLPIFDIMESMESALAGMGSAGQAAYIQKIFGQEALKSVQSLLGQGISSVRAYSETLRNSGGSAAEMATKQLDNMNGAVTILGSAWEGLQISIGSIFLPVLTPLIRGLSSVISWLGAVASHPVGKAFIAVAAAIAGVVVVAGLFSAALWGASLAAGALNMSLLANPIVLICAAIVGLIALVNELLQDVNNFASLGAMWTEVVNAFNNIGWRTGLQLLWGSLSSSLKYFVGFMATIAIAALAIFVSPFVAGVAIIIGIVGGIAGAIAWYWDDIGAFFPNLWDGICKGAAAAFGVLADLFLNFTPLGLLIKHFDDIVSFLSSIDLAECGRKLWQTFTDGLNSMISAPVETVKSGLQAIRNMLPFSDARTGPLSTLTLSGQRMMTTLAGGVGEGASALFDAVSGALSVPGDLLKSGLKIATDIFEAPANLMDKGLDIAGELLFGPTPEPALAGPAPAKVPPITKPTARTSNSSRSSSKSGGITIKNLTLNLSNVNNVEGLTRELQKLVSRYDG